MSLEFKFANAKQLVEQTLELDYFCEDAPAIPYLWAPSAATNPLIVVVGENASGKSFFRRCVQAVCNKAQVECIPISMEGRRQVAYNIGLTFVYGDESCDATGINSIRTVLTGIKTCEGRDKPHVIVWDEPDVGLSEGNAASVGKAIADFTRSTPKLTRASIVVTHRKALVTELARERPHYLYLGAVDGPTTVDAWLAQPPIVRSLEDVQNAARERFRAIQKILNRVKAHT